LHTLSFTMLLLNANDANSASLTTSNKKQKTTSTSSVTPVQCISTSKASKWNGMFSSDTTKLNKYDTFLFQTGQHPHPTKYVLQKISPDGYCILYCCVAFLTNNKQNINIGDFCIMFNLSMIKYKPQHLSN
jgi:hypothetical protein